MNFKMYKVFRDGKPIEENLYYTRKEAEDRADALRAMLKRWDPKDVKNVSIRTVSKKYK